MSTVPIAVDELCRASADPRIVAGKRENRAPASLRHFVRWIAAIGLAVSSAGCLLTQDIPDPALDMPRRYKAASGSELAAPPPLDWWRGFGSRELTQLMEEAQSVNLDIAAAVARFRQADALARQAGAALLPSLSSTGQETYSRTSGSSSSGLTNGGREVVNYQASLSASYQLDFFGQNRDALQAAEETALANRFDRDVTQLTTLATVANAYFQVLAAQDRIRTAERNIASATRVLDAIRERQKAGTGNDLDVAQQESVLANQKAAVPPLRQTLDQNVNALAVLVARSPEGIRVIGGSLDQIRTPRVTPGLPSEILTQRPDIRRQEAQLASATANVGSARAQFFPSIQLTGNGGYQSAALTSLFQPHAAFFSLAGSLTQPIFDGGRILGNFENAKARQDELLQTYRKTVIQAFTDVDNALFSIKQTTIRLQLQRQVVTASRRAFELSEQQLRAGTADIVTVLNTQLTLFQAEDALWQAQLARLQAFVSLYQALGGGWEPRMEKSADAL
ncbi:efflux transporter outer membrane subunit [Bradyrhizobium oligotrophicum]|uniref:efflux transporter outer membrane subunit n=1 Tax=Bradyrhizobium TaxID=374 RepID=UPI003EBEE6EC